jgi:uncharacterized protein (DUF58 family)
VVWRVVAAGGFLAATGGVHPSRRLRVYPAPHGLRELVIAHETSLIAGTHVARAKGPGLEFAELRPYRPGDRARQVNWRASARRGEPWVNDRHPERSIDVVVLVDSFAIEELPRAIVAADALVRAHLHSRDRVGLVSFGGTTRWVRPGTGMRQLYVLADSLIESQVFASAAWRDLTVVPARALPPHAVVVAVSPLRDDRMVAALHDLADRGRDVGVLGLAPAVPPPRGAEGRLAARLRDLHWASRLDDLRDRSIPAVGWSRDVHLGAVVEELAAQHRRMAGAR